MRDMGRRQAAPLMSVEATSGGAPDGGAAAGLGAAARGAGGVLPARLLPAATPVRRAPPTRVLRARHHTPPLHTGTYIARDFHNFFRLLRASHRRPPQDPRPPISNVSGRRMTRNSRRSGHRHRQQLGGLGAAPGAR